MPAPREQALLSRYWLVADALNTKPQQDVNVLDTTRIVLEIGRELGRRILPLGCERELVPYSGPYN